MDFRRKIADQNLEIERLRGYNAYLEKRLREMQARLIELSEQGEKREEADSRLAKLEKDMTRMQERNGRLKKRAKFWKRIASFRHRASRRRRHG